MSRPAETARTLATFFDQAAHEYDAAAASAGAVERDLCFAGRRVRLRFAGRELAGALLGALTPRLAAVGGPPHATISLWEERHAPGFARPVPWREAEVGPRGLVRGSSEGRVAAVHEAGSGAVTLVDRRARALLYRVPACTTLPWWERAAPLRPALFWALAEPGCHLVHAGAVGDERGGVLLAGAGGSGKTTVALAALAAGMRYVSDDYLLLNGLPTAGEESTWETGETSAPARRPTAWNMFGTAKLDGGHLARFPRFAAAASMSARPEDGEKAVLDVAGLMPEALVSSLPIRAVLVPRIRGGRAVLRRASAGEALLALAPSTALQIPFDDGRVVGALAAVTRIVPAFALDVGDRVEELAQAIDRVLETVAVGAHDAVATAPPRREVLI